MFSVTPSPLSCTSAAAICVLSLDLPLVGSPYKRNHVGLLGLVFSLSIVFSSML